MSLTSKGYKLLYGKDGRLTSMPDKPNAGIEFAYKPGVVYEAPETGPFFVLSNMESAIRITRLIDDISRVQVWQCVFEPEDLFVGVYRIPAPDILSKQLAIAFWGSIRKVAPAIVKGVTPKMVNEEIIDDEEEPCLTIEFEPLYRYYQEKEATYLQKFNRSPFISSPQGLVFGTQIKLVERRM